LSEHVRSDNSTISSVLADWLGSVFTADSLDEALVRRTELPSGAVMVTAGGDLLSSTSLTFFAPDKSEHGLLERQREIETLGEGIAAYEEQAEAVRSSCSCSMSSSPTNRMKSAKPGSTSPIASSACMPCSWRF
jgi:chromosome segregation protein